MFKLKLKPKSILLYLFVYSLIYQSGSVRAAVLGEGILFQITRALMLVVPIMMIMLNGLKNKTFLLVSVFVLIGIIFVGINYFLFPDGVLRLIYKIVILILSMGLYSTLIRKNIDIDEYIYKAIIVIAGIGLVLYVGVELMKLPIPYSILYSGNSYRYRNYFELFFSYHYNDVIPRFSGLFWEPGAYQIYLNIALFLYVFEKKESKIELGILLISVLFCQSTIGYCITAMLLAIHFSQRGFFNKRAKKIILVLGILVALVVACFIVYQKVKATSGYAEGSAALRFADIANGLSVFSNHPIIGTGFGNESEFVMLDMFGRGSSNGLLSYAYMTGIVGLLFAFSPFISNYLHYRDKMRQMVWIVIIIFVNCGEPIYNLPIMPFLLGVEYIKMFERKSILYKERLTTNVM